jgi:MFS family permease
MLRVISVARLLWAGIQMAMAAGKSFGSLAALRILLGVFEAAVNPGFTIITSTWYKPSEHALRHGLWYGGASVAYIFGGILAYAISHINSAISSWQVSSLCSCSPFSSGYSSGVLALVDTNVSSSSSSLVQLRSFGDSSCCLCCPRAPRLHGS